MTKATPSEIKSALAEIPGWRKKASAITRTYEFADFQGAMKFVIAVAKIAERAQHHPDFEIRWNKVLLSLTTHDSGGLTEKDFKLAAKIDAL